MLRLHRHGCSWFFFFFFDTFFDFDVINKYKKKRGVEYVFLDSYSSFSNEPASHILCMHLITSPYCICIWIWYLLNLNKSSSNAKIWDSPCLERLSDILSSPSIDPTGWYIYLSEVFLGITHLNDMLIFCFILNLA